jgi:hypothetical protein
MLVKCLLNSIYDVVYCTAVLYVEKAVVRTQETACLKYDTLHDISLHSSNTINAESLVVSLSWKKLSETRLMETARKAWVSPCLIFEH